MTPIVSQWPYDSNCKASDPILRKLPSIPCLWCKYTDKIKFDLSLHYIKFHRRKLIELPIGKGSLEKRADYAVEKSIELMVKLSKDDQSDD